MSEHKAALGPKEAKEPSRPTAEKTPAKPKADDKSVHGPKE